MPVELTTPGRALGDRYRSSNPLLAMATVWIADDPVFPGAWAVKDLAEDGATRPGSATKRSHR
jgi:hypothetical protein